MSRIFWDTMLFVYLLEGHKKYAPLVRSLLQKSYERDDHLVTSYLAVAEMLAGVSAKSSNVSYVISTIEEMGFSFVEFAKPCVEPFRLLRREYGLRAPDSMHLACASAAKTDLFITGDQQLLGKRLMIPGIQFIVNFEHAPL